MEFDNFSSAANERFNELEASHTWSLSYAQSLHTDGDGTYYYRCCGIRSYNSEAMLTMLYSAVWDQY